MSSITEQIEKFGVVPVIVIDDPEDAAPLAGALLEGGLPCAEVTLRTPRALDALRAMTAAYPGVLAGAGTVLSVRQAEQALDAAAQFVVTPGFNPRVVDYCLERGVPVFPGVCTPTEIDMALERELEVLKFFPAEPMGGVGFLKAICGPYNMLRFIPTGGVNLGNLPAYLALEQVVACGGSWLAPTEWVRTKQFDRIRAEVEGAVRAVAQIKGEA